MEGQDNNTNPQGASTNTGANNEPVGATTPQNTGTDSKPVTFDDFLKNGENQAEFDRRVQKAIQTAQENWKAKNDAEKSEAERLAQMNETEKLQYQLQKQQKVFQHMLGQDLVSDLQFRIHGAISLMRFLKEDAIFLNRVKALLQKCQIV